MASVSLDIAVHMFYGLGNDPAKMSLPSPYYTKAEQYGQVQDFMKATGMSIDDYVNLLGKMWMARFEQQANDGGYLVIIPNACFDIKPTDNVFHSRNGKYRLRHAEEENLVARARELYAERVVISPDPDDAASRLATRMKLKHGRVFKAEGLSYGEMSHECVYDNSILFLERLALYLSGTEIKVRIEPTFCGDRADGKLELFAAKRRAEEKEAGESIYRHGSYFSSWPR